MVLLPEVAQLEGSGESPMADFSNLDDEMVKLVSYTIVSLKRGEERVMDGGEGNIVVADRMTAEIFTQWIIARYLQQTVSTADGKEQLRGAMLPETERKYLRVYFAVPHRWPRLSFSHDEKEIDVLRDIRRALEGKSESSR
jgi:hypothetical protein